ncbi:MAG: hypothetical protein WBW48_15215 [Anaerolineae bacterium]
MLIEQVAERSQTKPEVLEREGLKLYLEKKLRVVESELFLLTHRYGVRDVTELDEMIKQGKFHEDEAFEDYFNFDYFEHEREKLLQVLEEL